MEEFMMNINVKEENGILTLYTEGRIDTITALDFQKNLLSAIESYDRIIVDLKKVTYISSAGLRSFLIGQKKVNSLSKTMELINVSDEIMEIFRMTGFSNVLKII